MNLLKVALFLAFFSCALGSISQLNLNPTGNFAKLTTKQGLWVSIIILKILILGELGFFPYRFKGRKKRKIGRPDSLVGLEDTNSVLQLIRSLDHRDCLLRYLCELEASRIESINSNKPLDFNTETDLVLLKIATKKMHPGAIMLEDPGNPALPFETAVFTGSQGMPFCADVFQHCPYNLTTMQSFTSL